MSEEVLNQTDNEEFEEICSDEVDHVVDVLDKLIESVASENIKHYLEEASSSIYYLVYEDSDGEDQAEPPLEDAA